MPKQGKGYRKASGSYDSLKYHELEEGLAVVKSLHYVKFDESVDIAVRLGVDPRHADQMVRGAVSLPHGIGKTVRVLVFAKGDKVAEARDAGADFVGGMDLVEKIQGGWMEFDKVMATPDMMGAVGRIGRVLGPRGLMPNPKTGTVTFDVGPTVTELKAGRIQFRVEKAGIIHVPVGRMSFDVDRLHANVSALLDTLVRLKPASAKGSYVKSITLSGTMTPGVRIDTASALKTARA